MTLPRPPHMRQRPYCRHPGRPPGLPSTVPHLGLTIYFRHAHESRSPERYVAARPCHCPYRWAHCCRWPTRPASHRLASLHPSQPLLATNQLYLDTHRNPMVSFRRGNRNVTVTLRLQGAGCVVVPFSGGGCPVLGCYRLSMPMLHVHVCVVRVCILVVLPH